MKGLSSHSAGTDHARAAAQPVSLQPASADIWARKYQLRRKDGTPVDRDVDGTFSRVARALADVESTPALREHWHGEFLWALRRGAVPAGRILSNAGALEYKPATSTINCTVSGTIGDSMNDILLRLHEAGMTLKSGAGIGYEFSTLRPKGAWVAGADAQTSGPLSFMDIYDRMCFTISSAGGRRGAQMATFDVGHPDVLDFIRVKREPGRLRQFNLSLLVTDEFMEAVKSDGLWRLAFPVTPREAEEARLDLADPAQTLWREWPITKGYIVNDAGFVACRIYRTLPARRLWDVVMASTYDFAEPGVVFIDRANTMNNNWFCENIRSTNPCVTADTWIHTACGPKLVSDLIGTTFSARVGGVDYASSDRGFFRTATKPVVRVLTAEGHAIRLTEDHRLLRVTRFTRFETVTQWSAAGDLKPGDLLLLNDHRANACWTGQFSFSEGYLLGLLVGDGTLKKEVAVLSTWRPALAAGDNDQAGHGIQGVMDEAFRAANSLPHRSDFKGWLAVPGRNESRLTMAALKRLAESAGMSVGNKSVTPVMERGSSDFYRGFLRGLFDTDGSVQGSQVKGVSVRLAQSDLLRLEAVQRMLLRLGIASVIYRNRRPAGTSRLPDGKGGIADYATKPQHELVVTGENLIRFRDLIGFADGNKLAKLSVLLTGYRRALNRERFVARVASVENAGFEEVFDVQVPDINAYDANGLYAHNCGEQILPPFGSCLLGSVNLTCFVREPFTDRARFDWEEFRKVTEIFTRMLDNVVEIHGLPLAEQGEEIRRKRRHGMGILGLGSALVMLRLHYGDEASIRFTEEVAREMALVGWRVALQLAKEKGPAPIMEEEFTVSAAMLRKRPEMAKDGIKQGDRVKGRVLHARYSRYMQRIAEVEPELVAGLAATGARFTHHSSIAPTGTISLSVGNNASNGIEPSFAHRYSRNVIRPGRKSKEKVDVWSYELLAYRALVNPAAAPDSREPAEQLPDYFVAAEDVTPRQHVAMQAAAQRWVDSSISKTANVPADFPFEDFKDIYLQGFDAWLKGCTTFRFNPHAFQGVLVRDRDLANTRYRFTLADGSVVELRGDEEIEYEGEVHTAANLYDAIKEGYYGRF